MSLFVARPYALSEDAAVVVGFAGTAISFATSREDEAERWLRALRLHGEAGRALQALGVPESPLEPSTPLGDQDSGERGRDVVGSITQRAAAFAHDRGAGVIGTADVLRSALVEYGASFDRLLERRGTSRDELLDCLAARTSDPTTAEASG